MVDFRLFITPLYADTDTEKGKVVFPEMKGSFDTLTNFLQLSGGPNIFLNAKYSNG